MPNFKKFLFFEIIFLVVVVATTFYFLSDGLIDLKFASAYYHPQNLDNPWFEQNDFLWKFFYWAAPALTGLFILPSLVIFILSYIKLQFTPYRKKALFVLLIVIIGPGILVNTLFKPGWGRPRPREVIELGGVKTFQSFVVRGEPRTGMSFPCGHCSVGFSTIALYFLLKRRRQKLAILAALSSTGLGLLMGVGRMADGAHFFSDVIWAGLMTYTPAFILYYSLKLYEDQKIETLNPRKAKWITFIFSLVLLVSISLATPFKDKKNEKFKENEFNFEIDEGVVEVIIDDKLSEPIELVTDVQGFGFPKSGLNRTYLNSSTLKIQKRGLITDFEAKYKIKIRSDLEFLKVKILKKGQVLKPANLNPKFIFEVGS